MPMDFDRVWCGQRGRFAPRARMVMLLAIAGLGAGVLAAQGTAGPGGVNIGFDFNWACDGRPCVGQPAGYSAAFINTPNASGAPLTLCLGGSVTPSLHACNFVISYTIGGVAQPALNTGGIYDTWPNSSGSGVFCNSSPARSTPLTLFNCFNQNSYGEIFLAGATGTLGNVAMPMTCLNPSGSPPTGLIALIYQINPNGNSIPATPLAQTPVDLSGCPTLTSWSNHLFSASDFQPIALNFTGVSVTQGNFYGIFFGGLVPGTQPPGAGNTTSVQTVPTLSALGMILLGVTLVAAGTWKLRGRLAA
jgi:hypothetical protein